MMKFFRRNTKTLLAVFMALLLIVWLGGQALETLFTQKDDVGDDVIAEAFGQPVKQNELARADAQSNVGQSLVSSWHMPWFSVIGKMGLPQEVLQSLQWQLRRDALKSEEWYLLDAEAQKNGVYVPAEQVDQVKSMMSPEMLTSIRDQHKLSIDQIDQTIRAYLRVEQAALQAADAIAVSEADIQDYIRQTAEKVKADIVMLDPAKLVDANYKPTDAEIQAQFDKYKNKPAGQDQSDFGYQLPNATQIEYLAINVDEVAKAQSISDDEAYTNWLAHKEEFNRPASQPASTAPAARPEPPKPYDTFYEARADVVKKLQHEKAVRIADVMGENLVKQLSKPWADQPTTQPDGYKEAPASEKAADLYEKLIVSRRTDKYGAAVSYGRTGVVGEKELSADPKIGGAIAFSGTQSQLQMSQLAFMVAGLKADKKDVDESTAKLYRNLYQTCPEPVSDSKGSVYVFRNLAVRPAQAPASIDENLRTKLIKDVQYVRALEEAAKQAKALAEQARKSGLKAAFDGSELAKKLEASALVSVEPFARKISYARGGMPQLIAGFVPGIGLDPELVDLCFGMGTRVTATQPSPIATHEQKQGGKWMVVEFKRLLPVTRDEYNQEREKARSLMLSQKRVRFVIDWFNADSIMARTGWHDKNASDSQKPDKKPKRASGS